MRGRVLNGILLAMLAIIPLAQAQANPPAASQQDAPDLTLPRIEGVQPKNIVIFLTDDHRYDAMGFLGHPFLKTPAMDSMAKNGVHFANAFVTTSLCSPSRATILTGEYAHTHRVVSNNEPVPPGTIFFPQYLQMAGYQTGFFGKWHMGHSGDRPQPGFNRWVSFAGQGTYYPGKKTTLNVDGETVAQKGYITDELTDYTLDFLKGRDKDRPFMVYLSHKGVHADFQPAERHRGMYSKEKFTPPKTMADSAENRQGRPMWTQNQRNSWHGVDYPYHSDLDIGEYYKQYCETLVGVDESLGRVLNYLKENDLEKDTLVIYLGDNGFCFGEHGLIDKRHAYEASMRIPMLMQCPGLFEGGRTVTELVNTLDIAPTCLAAAGLQDPQQFVGASVLPLAEGKKVPWRNAVLYEYYWEPNFPQTPTLFALRTPDYKYIFNYGVWDTDELYDLKTDPEEAHNLVNNPKERKRVQDMRRELFSMLQSSGGLNIPVYPVRQFGNARRDASKSSAAEFPQHILDTEPRNHKAH